MASGSTEGGTPGLNMVSIHRPLAALPGPVTELLGKTPLRSLLEACPIPTFVKDTCGRYVLFNEQAERLLECLGLRPAEVVGRTALDVFPRELAERVANSDRRVVEEHTPLMLEEYPWSKSGEQRYLAIKVPLRDACRTVVGVCSFYVDLTAIKKEENRLRENVAACQRQAEALARANAELADFAHLAAHDLREPLRAMRLTIGMLREDAGPKLSEYEHHRLEALDDQARRMLGLLEAMLGYSSAGRARPRLEPVDLGELLAEVVHDLGPALAQAGARVETSQGVLPTILADRAMLTQILTNLIANGVKYNDSEQKLVHVSARLGGEGPTINVRDNGIGIRPENRDRVFQMFTRLHTRDEYGGGTGAGLAIARKMVEAHGGRMWVVSTPGKGSTFSFTLGGSGQPGRP